MVQPIRLMNWNFRISNNSEAEFYELFAKFMGSRRRRIKTSELYETVLCGQLYGEENSFVRTFPIVAIWKVKGIWIFCHKDSPREYYAKTQDGSIYYFCLRNALPEVRNRVDYIVKCIRRK